MFNTLTYLFLAALGINLLVTAWLARRHIQHVASHRDQVPADFADSMSLADHQKASDYTAAKTYMGLFDACYGGVILLLLILGGGLNWLDQWSGGLGLGPILTGGVFLLSLILLLGALDLPLDLYRTFVLEERFGFNKTTTRTFNLDLVKQFALLLVLGGPLALLILWFVQTSGPWWWLWTWIIWTAFSLLMVWAFPTFIAPLFNKFSPLKDESLRQRIEALLERTGFTSKGVYVLDGSARSSHGNAYFSGFGKNKRIVFFDTLLDSLNADEVEAVLAHELGHFKLKHVRKRLITITLLSLLGLALLGWLAQQSWFYQGLGVQQASIHVALALFLIVSPVMGFFLQPLAAWSSRRHEFQADAFATSQVKSASLVSALVKMYRDNASTLTPDPLFSKFHDSHPPAPIRIAEIKSHA